LLCFAAKRFAAELFLAAKVFLFGGEKKVFFLL